MVWNKQCNNRPLQAEHVQKFCASGHQVKGYCLVQRLHVPDTVHEGEYINGNAISRQFKIVHTNTTSSYPLIS
jgi:hypothetical protein